MPAQQVGQQLPAEQQAPAPAPAPVLPQTTPLATESSASSTGPVGNNGANVLNGGAGNDTLVTFYPHTNWRGLFEGATGTGAAIKFASNDIKGGLIVAEAEHVDERQPGRRPQRQFQQREDPADPRPRHGAPERRSRPD